MKKNLLLALCALIPTSFIISQAPVESPHAPDLATEYLGDGVISITLSNDNPQSNNYQESFSVFDDLSESTWGFEGYKVYQVDIPISGFDLSNTDDFRLITGGQSDIQNESSNLINYVYDPSIEFCVPVQMVDGGNTGLMNVYNANTDAFTGLPFAEGEFYCFIAVAYAANNSGISAECNNIYQYIESTDAADGDITIQCSTVTVGIEEQNEVSFKMYPNPANSDLIVQMNNIQQVRILNLIGEVVLFEEFSGNSKQKISLEQLSPGIYLVSATNSRGIIRTQRLEIN